MRVAIVAQSCRSTASAGVSQLPPTQPTLGVFRYSATFVGVIPPVGQNRAAGTGEWIARR